MNCPKKFVYKLKLQKKINLKINQLQYIYQHFVKIMLFEAKTER